MDVYWMEQCEADMPTDDDWLSPREAIFLRRLRFPKRRADWRLGRWTAKCLLADFLNTPRFPRILASIELRPSESGAPELFIKNKPHPFPISLSHRAGIAVCAIAPSGSTLGCDLELIEPRSAGFLADYFTTEEQALIAQASPADRVPLVTLLWSAKESVLKAVQSGLRTDTRSVSVNPCAAFQAPGSRDDRYKDCPREQAADHDSKDWRPRECHCEGQSFHGWWSQNGSFIRTVVAAPPSAAPIVVAQRFVIRGDRDNVLSKAS